LLIRGLRRQGECLDEAGALQAVVVTCLLLWLAARPALTFAIGGLNRDAPTTHMLSAYLGFLLVRCELLVLLMLLLAGGVILYLCVEKHARHRPSWKTLAPVGAMLAYFLPVAVVFGGGTRSGLVTLPATTFFAITGDDVKLAEWA